MMIEDQKIIEQGVREIHALANAVRDSVAAWRELSAEEQQECADTFWPPVLAARDRLQEFLDATPVEFLELAEELEVIRGVAAWN